MFLLKRHFNSNCPYNTELPLNFCASIQICSFIVSIFRGKMTEQRTEGPVAVNLWPFHEYYDLWFASPVYETVHAWIVIIPRS